MHSCTSGNPAVTPLAALRWQNAQSRPAAWVWIRWSKAIGCVGGAGGCAAAMRGTATAKTKAPPASTTAGTALRGQTRLSHKLPDAPSFVQPQPDATNVPVKSLQIRWRPAKGVAKQRVVIEHEPTGNEFRMNLPPASAAFVVPDGFLSPGRKYKLGISAVSNDGNSTVIETDFTTASGK